MLSFNLWSFYASHPSRNSFVIRLIFPILIGDDIMSCISIYVLKLRIREQVSHEIKSRFSTSTSTPAWAPEYDTFHIWNWISIVESANPIQKFLNTAPALKIDEITSSPALFNTYVFSDLTSVHCTGCPIFDWKKRKVVIVVARSDSDKNLLFFLN